MSTSTAMPRAGAADKQQGVKSLSAQLDSPLFGEMRQVTEQMIRSQFRIEKLSPKNQPLFGDLRIELELNTKLAESVAMHIAFQDVQSMMPCPAPTYPAPYFEDQCRLLQQLYDHRVLIETLMILEKDSGVDDSGAKDYGINIVPVNFESAVRSARTQLNWSETSKLMLPDTSRSKAKNSGKRSNKKKGKNQQPPVGNRLADLLRGAADMVSSATNETSTTDSSATDSSATQPAATNLAPSLSFMQSFNRLKNYWQNVDESLIPYLDSSIVETLELKMEIVASGYTADAEREYNRLLLAYAEYPQSSMRLTNTIEDAKKIHSQGYYMRFTNYLEDQKLTEDQREKLKDKIFKRAQTESRESEEDDQPSQLQAQLTSTLRELTKSIASAFGETEFMDQFQDLSVPLIQPAQPLEEAFENDAWTDNTMDYDSVLNSKPFVAGEAASGESLVTAFAATLATATMLIYRRSRRTARINAYAVNRALPDAPSNAQAVQQQPQNAPLVAEPESLSYAEQSQARLRQEQNRQREQRLRAGIGLSRKRAFLTADPDDLSLLLATTNKTLEQDPFAVVLQKEILRMNLDAGHKEACAKRSNTLVILAGAWSVAGTNIGWLRLCRIASVLVGITGVMGPLAYYAIWHFDAALIAKFALNVAVTSAAGRLPMGTLAVLGTYALPVGVLMTGGLLYWQFVTHEAMILNLAVLAGSCATSFVLYKGAELQFKAIGVEIGQWIKAFENITIKALDNNRAGMNNQESVRNQPEAEPLIEIAAINDALQFEYRRQTRLRYYDSLSNDIGQAALEEGRLRIAQDQVILMKKLTNLQPILPQLRQRLINNPQLVQNPRSLLQIEQLD